MFEDYSYKVSWFYHFPFRNYRGGGGGGAESAPHPSLRSPKISRSNRVKDSQNLFMNFLPLHTSCLFPTFLNEDIVDIGKPDGVCSLTFVVDYFSGLFLHPSIFFIKDSRSA